VVSELRSASTGDVLPVLPSWMATCTGGVMGGGFGLWPVSGVIRMMDPDWIEPSIRVAAAGRILFLTGLLCTLVLALIEHTIGTARSGCAVRHEPQVAMPRQSPDSGDDSNILLPQDLQAWAEMTSDEVVAEHDAIGAVAPSAGKSGPRS
jgi:hypothetical protein